MLMGMRLADYLSDHKIKDATFAAQIGVTRQAVGRYKFGERKPEWAILQRIANATEGHVTPNDFLDAPEGGPEDEAPHVKGARSRPEQAA